MNDSLGLRQQAEQYTDCHAQERDSFPCKMLILFKEVNLLLLHQTILGNHFKSLCLNSRTGFAPQCTCRKQQVAPAVPYYVPGLYLSNRYISALGYKRTFLSLQVQKCSLRVTDKQARKCAIVRKCNVRKVLGYTGNNKLFVHFQVHPCTLISS